MHIARLQIEGQELQFAVADERDHIQRRLLAGELYEAAMLRDMRQRCDTGGGVAIDVGAHVGTHSIFLGAICRQRVLAFEPQEAARRLLLESIKLNGLEGRVTVLPHAVGERPGRGVLRAGTANSGMASLELLDDGEPSGAAVDVVRLDDLDTPGPVRLIKIDVEGMECDVLRGAAGVLRRDRPLVYCETADDEAFRRVSALLHDLGYWPAARFNHTPTLLFLPGPPADPAWAALTQAHALQLHGEQELRREVGKLRRVVEQQAHELKRLTRLAEPALRAGSEALLVHYFRAAANRPWPEALLLPLRLGGLAAAVALRRRHQRTPAGATPPTPARSPRGGLLAERVSVVMTAFNSARTIEAAVAAVLGQSYENLELIVVDDASEDETFAVLERLARGDDRLRPVQALHNRGTYYCKNVGILMATGGIIACHDSDDTSDPDWLALHVAELKRHPDAAVVRSDYVRLDDTGQVRPNRGAFARPALVSQTFRREVFERLGFFDSVRISADHELAARLDMVLGRHAVHYLPRVLYQARIRAGSLTDVHPVSLDADPREERDFLSPVRRSYIEAGQGWLLQRGRRAYVGFPLPKRRWPADGSILAQKDARDEPLVVVAAGDPAGLREELEAVADELVISKSRSTSSDEELASMLRAIGGRQGVVVVLGRGVRRPRQAVQWSLLKLDQYGRSLIAGDGWRGEGGEARHVRAVEDGFDRVVAVPGATLLAFRTAVIDPGALACDADGRAAVLADAQVPVIVPGVNLVSVPSASLPIERAKLERLAAIGKRALSPVVSPWRRYSAAALRSRQVDLPALLGHDVEP